MSYRIVPPSLAASDSAHVVSHKDVANPQTGTRDTLRHGLKSGNGDAGTVHALQSRLEQWQATQTQMKMTLQRNVYGIALPLRTMMEKNLVAETQDNHFPALTASELPLGGSMNIHAEILAGTDESIDVGDFMSGGALPKETVDIHSAMEKRKGMTK